jgi:hypothetical protein
MKDMNKEYILGVFSSEDDLVAAFTEIKNKGIKPVEVYTPYPVHEILEGMGHKTRITHAAFLIGLLAAIGLLGFMYWAAAISWPMFYGGKPPGSFPSFIVVTIVGTILTITLLTLFIFSFRAQVFPGKIPDILHHRATDDKFVIVLDKNSLGNNASEIQSLIKKHGEIE